VRALVSGKICSCLTVQHPLFETEQEQSRHCCGYMGQLASDYYSLELHRLVQKGQTGWRGVTIIIIHSLVLT